MMQILQNYKLKKLLPFIFSIGLIGFAIFGQQEFKNDFELNSANKNELNQLFIELANSPNAIVSQAIEEDIYIKIMTAPNQYINGLMAIAKTHENNNELQEALNLYLKIVEISPNFSGAFSSAGALYFQLNDFENAKKMLKAAIRIEPRNYSALSGLGTIEMNDGDYKNAKIAFGNALLINPYDEIAKRGLINIEYKTKGIGM